MVFLVVFRLILGRTGEIELCHRLRGQRRLCTAEEGIGTVCGGQAWGCKVEAAEGKTPAILGLFPELLEFGVLLHWYDSRGGGGGGAHIGGGRAPVATDVLRSARREVVGIGHGQAKVIGRRGAGRFCFLCDNVARRLHYAVHAGREGRQRGGRV